MRVKTAWRIVRTCADAMRHFSRNCRISGIPAAVRRDTSSVARRGDMEVIRRRPRAPSAIDALDTATWRLPDLAQRAAILPLHADRARALFREAGVVDGKDACPHGYAARGCA